MSDTMAAVLILPVLIALVVALECGRTGCTWLSRRLRRPSVPDGFTGHPQVSAAQDY